MAMEESEIIDRYLRGELDPVQADDFNHRLQSDTDLQRKVALRKLVIAGIAQAYAQELKTKLIDFDQSLESKKRFHFSWKTAAVFAIIIVSASILYMTNQKPNPYDYDVVEVGLPNKMGATDEIELNNAMSIFKAGDYETSGKIFNALLNNKPNSDTLLYFSGLCDFRNKLPEGAIKKWAQIESGSIFFEKTEYRLAIAYWVKGDKKLAADLLERIASRENDSLSKPAKKALEVMN
jgi:hypothetical protein